MYNYVYVLVPITVPSTTILDTRLVHEEIEVENLLTCTLWCLNNNREILDQETWFDTNNIVFQFQTRTLIFHPSTTLNDVAILATKAMKEHYRPPALN